MLWFVPQLRKWLDTCCQCLPEQIVVEKSEQGLCWLYPGDVTRCQSVDICCCRRCHFWPRSFCGLDKHQAAESCACDTTAQRCCQTCHVSYRCTVLCVLCNHVSYHCTIIMHIVQSREFPLHRNVRIVQSREFPLHRNVRIVQSCELPLHCNV